MSAIFEERSLASRGGGKRFDPGAMDHHGLFLIGGFAELAGSWVGGFEFGDPATDCLQRGAPALKLLIAVLIQRVGLHGGVQQLELCQIPSNLWSGAVGCPNREGAVLRCARNCRGNASHVTL